MWQTTCGHSGNLQYFSLYTKNKFIKDKETDLITGREEVPCVGSRTSATSVKKFAT